MMLYFNELGMVKEFALRKYRTITKRRKHFVRDFFHRCDYIQQSHSHRLAFIIVLFFYPRYIDYMLLMTYNYHGLWETQTGHHSPLYGSASDPPGEQSQLNQVRRFILLYCVSTYIETYDRCL